MANVQNICEPWAVPIVYCSRNALVAFPEFRSGLITRCIVQNKIPAGRHKFGIHFEILSDLLITVASVDVDNVEQISGHLSINLLILRVAAQKGKVCFRKFEVPENLVYAIDIVLGVV